MLLFSYNRDQFLEFGLDAVNNRQEIMEAVDDVMLSGSGTNTGAAMEYVLNNVLTAAGGRRADVPAFVIVITDGRSNVSLL